MKYVSTRLLNSQLAARHSSTFTRRYRPSPSDHTIAHHLACRLEELDVHDVLIVPEKFNMTLLHCLLQEKSVNVVRCCNVLNAGYAVNGYARRRGLGACKVDFTVGGLSVLNAIAEAYNERISVVCIVAGPNPNDYMSGRVLHNTTGNSNFSQERRCLSAVTCYQAVVRNLGEARNFIDKAFSRTLKESKQVYISIAHDLQAIPHRSFVRNPRPLILHPKVSEQEELNAAVEAVAAFLNKTVKPVLVEGPKLRETKARDAFLELANVSGYPMTVLPSAKGLVSEHSVRFVGIYGSQDAFCANFMESADAYLVVGPDPIFSSVGYPHSLKEAEILVHREHVLIDRVFLSGCILIDEFLSALSKRVKKNDYGISLSNQGPTLELETVAGSNELVSCNILIKYIELLLLKEDNFQIPAAATLLVFGLLGHVIIAESGDPFLHCQRLKLHKKCRFETQTVYESVEWSLGAALGYAQGCCIRTATG